MLTFVVPDGPDVQDPTPAQIDAAFERDRSEFWLTGSFDAGLYAGEQIGMFGLSFMPTDDAEGFVVLFVDGTGEAVLAAGTRVEGAATIQPGAQPFTVPAHWVVQPSVARDVARTFMRTRSRPDLPGHSWDPSWRLHPKDG